MEEFNFDKNGDDRELLALFIIWLRQFLGELITRDDLFYPELREPMIAAWNTVGGRFEKLEGRVKKISDDSMDAHGLTGAELRFKLSTIRLHSRRFIGNVKGFILKSLLGSSDTLLNSILSAMPVGGTAVSEFKDAVMDSIKE